MIDEIQIKKQFDKKLKLVPKNIGILSEDFIEIILGVHVCLQDTKKVLAWLQIKNPNFGGVEPIKLINMGRGKKVRQFVDNAANDGGYLETD